MNIDLENAICHGEEQRRKRYQKNNEYARARSNIAKETDALFYLVECPLTEEFHHHHHHHQIQDLQQEVKMISNEEDDIIGDRLCQNYNVESNDNNCTSDINNYILNDEPGEQKNDFYIDNFTDSATSDEDSNEATTEDPRIHEFTNITTTSYCTDLLNLLREAGVSKLHSKRLIALIQSVLPTPNNLPSTMDDLLLFMNIDDLFFKQSFCLVCKQYLEYKQRVCFTCKCFDEKAITDVYNVNVKHVLKTLLKRLSPIIEKYKKNIYDDIDEEETKDIPFGKLYKELLNKYASENIISLILHLDGVSLTRSSNLKMWLFSGSFVELPPSFRYRRYNMILLSIWVAYAEPQSHVWLQSIISQIQLIKMQAITISEVLSYKLKIFAITGDCPALKLVLKFTSHVGYYCCWLCYIRGRHVGGKRQYEFKLPMIMRDRDAYEEESRLAEQKQINVYGHLGLSVLSSVLDIPLPDAIIIDYLHVTLLGHAKALILNIFHSFAPNERLEVDNWFKMQIFPHYFNRKIKPISKFGFVKATEVKNILFYAALPVFQLYLSIEQLSHLALFICFTRLLHGQSIVGLETNKIAKELFEHFYRDHNEYYEGLQNLVLHLHVHFVYMYNNHGALTNIGCFGQEDLIGYIGSNHHGTRYYGELITYYYNIDFALHMKPTAATTKKIEKLDPVNDTHDEYKYLHVELCDCEQIHQCFRLYRRFIINDRIFHSLIYKKRGKSNSYFIQYSFDQRHYQFGSIQCFISLQSTEK
ncbi:unnamed protein product, partial [Rotaria magnacalcarata]